MTAGIGGKWRACDDCTFIALGCPGGAGLVVKGDSENVIIFSINLDEN